MAWLETFAARRGDERLVVLVRGGMLVEVNISGIDNGSATDMLMRLTMI